MEGCRAIGCEAVGPWGATARQGPSIIDNRASSINICLHPSLVLTDVLSLQPYPGDVTLEGNKRKQLPEPTWESCPRDDMLERWWVQLDALV